ncbi:MAG: neutral/alkaline non-lysosomal ceramidase N-terminal domain-containing protein [Candidatus Hydrogenedentota bacterium]
MAVLTWGFCMTLALLMASDAQALQAGAAKVDITPPLGAPLNGYGDRLGRGAEDVHDPITARALYLGDENTEVFLIAADLCIINRELRERVLQLAPEAVPRENIILTATHTHNAQGGMVESLAFRHVSGPYREDILDLTAQGFSEAMVEAYAAREEANVGFGTGEQDTLSRNRRVDDGPRDSQIGAILVEDLEGGPIAVLANFAAHPTTVSSEDGLTISADYPGFYYERIEELLGNGAVALFLNGAAGNQSVDLADEDLEGWERVMTTGEVLAEEVYDIVQDIEAEELPLYHRRTETSLPPTLASSILPDSTWLATLEIGDLLLCFFPGEPCVELGLELREHALARGYEAQFSVSQANDHLFYFAPREYYTTSHYEQEMSFYGPGIADWFGAQFGRLMTRGQMPGEGQSAAPGELTREDGEPWSLGGSSYGMGRQRGSRFAYDAQNAFEEWVAEPVRERQLHPEGDVWEWLPGFIDPSPFALPFLASEWRPELEGVAQDVLDDVEGLAMGAGIPADAALLLQLAPARPGGAAGGTAYSVTPEDSADGEGLAGYEFRTAAGDAAEAQEESGSAAPDIWRITPMEGAAFAMVGLPWQTGTVSGMNEHGVVVCLEAHEEDEDISVAEGRLQLVAHEILQFSESQEEALSRLDEEDLPEGLRVYVAAPGEVAQAVSFGPQGATEPRETSVLPEGMAAAPAGDEDGGNGEEGLSLSSAALREGLHTNLTEEAPTDHHVAHIVFEPGSRRLYAAITPAGQPLADWMEVLVEPGPEAYEEEPNGQEDAA